MIKKEFLLSIMRVTTPHDGFFYDLKHSCPPHHRDNTCREVTTSVACLIESNYDDRLAGVIGQLTCFDMHDRP